MPETGTSGSMSGAGKRSGLLVATAPHLDSTHGGEGRGFSPAVTRPPVCSSLASRAVPRLRDCAGGEAKRGVAPAILAGLKPRPSGAPRQLPRASEKSALALNYAAGNPGTGVSGGIGFPIVRFVMDDKGGAAFVK